MYTSIPAVSAWYLERDKLFVLGVRSPHDIPTVDPFPYLRAESVVLAKRVLYIEGWRLRRTLECEEHM